MVLLRGLRELDYVMCGLGQGVELEAVGSEPLLLPLTWQQDHESTPRQGGAGSGGDACM